MRTLHFGLRVADLDRSLAFYAALGYEVVGVVADAPIGRLTMLKLPRDPFVTIELVFDPAATGPGPADGLAASTGLSHFVVQVSDIRALVEHLAAQGIEAERPTSPDGSDDFLTSIVVDPDGNRIELVQWPLGHLEGFTASDFDAR